MQDFLTETVVEVLAEASDLAARAGAPDVRAGHLLLALMLKGRGAAECVLDARVLDFDVLKRRVDDASDAGAAVPVSRQGGAPGPFVRSVVTRALDHAARLGHPHAGAEHILLALLSDPGGEASRLLSQVGPRLPERIARQLADVSATDLFDRQGRAALEYEETAEVQRHASHPEVVRLRVGIADYTRQYQGQWEAHHALFRQDPERADDKAVLDAHFARLTRLEAEANALRLELGTLVQRLKQGEAGAAAYRAVGAEGLMRQATPRVGRIVRAAKDHARRLGHGAVSSDHLLSALLDEGAGVGLTMLRLAGADVAALRQAAAEHTGGAASLGSVARGDVPLSEGAEECLGLAWNKSRLLQSGYTGSEHLLWGITARGEGAAAATLRGAGVTTEQLDEAFWLLLGRFGDAEDLHALRAAVASPELFTVIRNDEPRLRPILEAMNEAVCNAEYERAGALRDEATAIQWDWVRRHPAPK